MAQQQIPVDILKIVQAMPKALPLPPINSAQVESPQDDTADKIHGNSKFDPKMIAQVEGYAGLGLTHAEIATMLGVHMNTITKWKQRSDDFNEAIKRGKLKANVNVANALYQKAVKDGNVVAMIFFLKNRAGWRDVQDVTVTNKQRIEFMPTDRKPAPVELPGHSEN